jgi:hypothetical protein
MVHKFLGYANCRNAGFLLDICVYLQKLEVKADKPGRGAGSPAHSSIPFIILLVVSFSSGLYKIPVFPFGLRYNLFAVSGIEL